MADTDEEPAAEPDDDSGPTLPEERLETLGSDPEARLEFLLSRDVLLEREDRSIMATEDFESDRGIYLDSYEDSSDEKFRDTVAITFDLSRAEAATRIEEFDLTRWDLATYLALQSYLEVSLPQDLLLELAALTAEAGSASPVPLELDELYDEDWDDYVADHGNVVLFVFQFGCDPCDAMKRNLAAYRSEAPEGVVFAGADGEAVPSLRREFDVTVAPTTLLFRDGDLADSTEGYASPETLAELFETVY